MDQSKAPAEAATRENWPSDAACRAANEAYHGGHHGYLGAMHAALRAAYAVDALSAHQQQRDK